MTSGERLAAAISRVLDDERKAIEAKKRNEFMALGRKLKKMTEQRDEWKYQALKYRQQVLELKGVK